MTTESESKSPNRPLNGFGWALALVPLLLLGAVLAYLVVTGGGLKQLAGPPVESLKIERITLPEPGLIKVEVVNDGPQTVTLPQVLVDDAYWQFSAEPSNVLPRLGRATFAIPYPWVEGEAHRVTLITSIGTTFEKEIPVAVPSPKPSRDLFFSYGLVGFYVGIVPIMLGMLWFPWMRRLSRSAMNFVLSLTVGLLVYLALGTYLDANEFAAELPAFWQGLPMVLLVATLSLGVLLVFANRKGKAQHPFSVSYQIAAGIGLHNLGEGLAIGAAFASGQAALGLFLVLGFTIHNITEGVGIAAPIVRQRPRLKQFGLLALVAGSPAIVGTWLGGFAFNPVLAAFFLAIGVGAIVQVVWEVGKLVAKDSTALSQPPLNWVNLSGLAAGFAIMYFTAFMVKF